MFTGFNLKINENFFQLSNINYEKWKKSQDEYKENVNKNLEKYLLPKDIIDGKNLRDEWFPEIKADIFISHSHNDKELATKLAYWLKENFGLTSFIDSYVWGYANDLLKKIDKEYCLHETKKNSFDYDKRNYSTSHVHMMLSTALREMINKTECIIFLNTENSLADNMKNIIENSTFSPWIFSEIVTTQLIQKNNISNDRIREILGEENIMQFSKQINEMAQLQIKYKLELNHLIDLIEDDLKHWKRLNLSSDTKYPLNDLYRTKLLDIEKKSNILEIAELLRKAT